ncbi:MAG: hypothetical protein U1E34_06945 [Amaricoccus sp.]
MPRNKTSRKPVEEAEDDLEPSFLSDEEQFLEDLRGAVARARSSSVDGFDPFDGPWGRSFDRLQSDLGD